MIGKQIKFKYVPEELKNYVPTAIDMETKQPVDYIDSRFREELDGTVVEQLEDGRYKIVFKLNEGQYNEQPVYVLRYEKDITIDQ